MRRVLKIAGYAALALVVLGLLAYLARDPLQAFLVQTATRLVSQGLAGSLEVGALRGPLLSSPVLYDVTLRDAQGEVVGQIAELRLAYNLKALLKKRLEVHAVEIVRPRLTLVQEPDGSLNLGNVLSPTPKEPAAGGGLPLALVVERLQIDDGELVLHLPALPGVQTLQGLQARLRAQVDEAGLRVEMQQLTAQARPADVTIHTLQGAIQMLGSVVHVDALRLQTDQTTVTADGVLLSKEPEARFAFQMQPLDVTEIGRLVQNEALQGQVHLALQVEGPAKAQRFQVQRFDLDTSVARMTAGGTLDLAGASDLRYELTADLASLQQLMGLEAVAGNVQMQGQASGVWPGLSVHGTLQAKALRYQDHGVDTLQLTYAGAQLGVQPRVTAQLLVRQARAGTLPVEQVQLDATYHGATPQVHFAAEVVQSANTGGQARGTLTLDGAAQQVVLEELQVRLPGRTWQAVAPLEVVLAQPRLHFKRIHLVHADESIELSGAVDGEHLQDIRLHAAQLDLAYLQRLLQLPDPVGGRATLHIQLAGTLAEPLVQGTLALQPAAPQQLPFEQLQTTLAYAQRRLQGDVRLLQANRDVLTLEVRLPVDMAFTALPLEQRLLDAPLSVDLHLKRWQPALPKLTGTLDGAMAVQGTYAALNLNADVQLQQLGMAGTAEQISAPLHLTGAIVMAASVSELARALQQGQVTPQVQHLELRIPILRGQLPAPGAPAEPFQVQDVLLQAAGQWTAAGPHATLQRLHLQASGPGWPRTEILLGAQLTPSRLELTRLQIRLPQSELQGQGHLTLPEQQLQFQVDIPHLRLADLPFAVPPNLPAVVQGGLTLRGSVQAPQMQARLQYAGAQVHADLGVQFQERLPRYKATLRLEGLALAQVLPEVQGRLQAVAQLQGQGLSGAQRQATLDLTVNTDGVSLAPELTARLQASLAGEVLAVKQLRVRSAPAELVASGTLSATKPAALQYRVTLGDLAALQKSLGVELHARGDLTGEVRGPLEALQTRGTLRLSAWRYAELRGERLQATFSATQLLGAPQATLQAQLMEVQGPSLPTSSLRLEGNYAAQQGIFAVAVTEGPYQHTRLAGNVTLAADQRLTLDTLRVQHHDLAWENAGPIEVVRRAQGELQVHRLVLRSGSQEISVRGTLGRGAADPFNLQIQAPEVDLSRLLPFSPAVTHSAGILSLDLQLTGTLQQPQAQGSLVFRNGGLQLAATGERYSDVQARLLFTGNRVQIEQLHVGSRSGPLRLTGQLAYTGLVLEWVDLALQAQQFTAMHTPAIETIVSADVSVRGSFQEMTATGSVTVPRARLVLNKLPGSAPKEVRPWELTVQGVYGPGPDAGAATNGAGPAPVAAPLPFLRADLQVDIPQNAWLQGPGTAVETRGNLRLTKDRNAPLILSGTIETVRGFAGFYGKKFVLEKGQVTFTGSPEINPLLDVTATRKVSDYAVAVHVEGKAEQPKITLSSTPELPQADILSLLLVGKTTDRLTRSEQTALSSQAQQLAGDIIAGQLEKTLGQPLGLDTIEVTAGDRLGTGSVRVGRYITQDIFLSYEREMGAEGGNTGSVEYSINRRLKLKGSGSDTGKTAIDFLWRIDY